MLLRKVESRNRLRGQYRRVRASRLKSLAYSQRLQKILDAHAGLTQHALQRFAENGFVVGHGEAHRAFAHPNVRPFLPHNLKTQTPQCADRFTPETSRGSFTRSPARGR